MDNEHFAVELIAGEVYPCRTFWQKVVDMVVLLGEAIAFLVVLAIFSWAIWMLAQAASGLVLR